MGTYWKMEKVRNQTLHQLHQKLHFHKITSWSMYFQMRDTMVERPSTSQFMNSVTRSWYGPRVCTKGHALISFFNTEVGHWFPFWAVILFAALGIDYIEPGGKREIILSPSQLKWAVILPLSRQVHLGLPVTFNCPSDCSLSWGTIHSFS